MLELFENNPPGWMCTGYLLKSCGTVAITFCYTRETKITIPVKKSNLLSLQNTSIHPELLVSILKWNFKHCFKQWMTILWQRVLRGVCLCKKQERAATRSAFVFALSVTIRVLCKCTSRKYIHIYDYLVTRGSWLPKQQHRSEERTVCATAFD